MAKILRKAGRHGQKNKGDRDNQLGSNTTQMVCSESPKLPREEETHGYKKSTEEQGKSWGVLKGAEDWIQKRKKKGTGL